MISQSDALTSSRDRPLRMRMRADLDFSRQTYQGRVYWVVRDPLTLSYYRFEEEEYRVLSWLDGTISPTEIQQRFGKQFAPQQLPLAELQQLLSRLHKSQLLVSDMEGQAAELCERGARRQSRTRWSNWTNVLCIRFPGVNPDRLLGWLSQYMGWFFSLPTMLASFFLILAALTLITVQFDAFAQRLPAFEDFFAARNWLLLATVLAGTKVLHELGHGLACKRFGGQCHELGFMLLVLTPCLYCNVSDSWMLPSKWRRAAIGAAGMYVELTIAAICTFVWWFSEVGMLHYLCLNIMFVCSVSTIVFNANPLLRYDGYFILADLVEIPNLRQKSSAIVQRKLTHWFLGIRPAPDPFLPKRRQAFFAAYSIGAIFYRWIVVVSILWFLYEVFEPYGLRVIGQMLVMLVLYGTIVGPLKKMIQFSIAPGRVRQMRKLRLVATGGLVVAFLAGVMLVPLPFYVPCPFVLRYHETATVYVDVPGTLEQLHVRAGQHVKRGQVLASLSNIEIELAVAQLEGERKQLAARLESLQMRSHSDEAALLEMAEVREALATLDQRVARRRADLQRLVIRAPRDGVLVAAPAISPPPQPDRLPAWTGHPLDSANRGAYLTEGVQFCQVAEPGKWEATLAIHEDVIQHVQPGQPVDLFPRQVRGMEFSGKVAQISKTDMNVTPAAFSVDAAHGAQTAKSSVDLTTLQFATYQASLPVDAGQTMLIAGGTGRARLHAGQRSLGIRMWDYFARTFHLRL